MYEIIVEINGIKKKYEFEEQDKYLTFLDGVICGLDLCNMKYTFKETVDIIYWKTCTVLKSV